MRYLLGSGATILLIVAAWFLYVGCSMDVTVPNTSALDGSGTVSNLQLMQIQLLDVIIGVAAGIASCILFAGAAILAEIARRAQV